MLSLAVTTTAAIVGVSVLLVLIVIPGVVTCLKGHWALFGAGLLIAGIVWCFSAPRLARPGSLWARWFYGSKKMDRALARYGQPASDHG